MPRKGFNGADLEENAGKGLRGLVKQRTGSNWLKIREFMYLIRNYLPFQCSQRYVTCLVALTGAIHHLRRMACRQPRRCRSLRGPSGREPERQGGASIRRNHMNLGAPSAEGIADGPESVFTASSPRDEP